MQNGTEAMPTKPSLPMMEHIKRLRLRHVKRLIQVQISSLVFNLAVVEEVFVVGNFPLT
jgi:hypothetical protein